MTDNVVLSIVGFSLVCLSFAVILQGIRVSDLKAETRTLRTRINALAGVVSANANRITRLETGDAPRRPACAATYIMDAYPKRADEL